MVGVLGATTTRGMWWMTIVWSLLVSISGGILFCPCNTAGAGIDLFCMFMYSVGVGGLFTARVFGFVCYSRCSVCTRLDSNAFDHTYLVKRIQFIDNRVSMWLAGQDDDGCRVEQRMLVDARVLRLAVIGRIGCVLELDAVLDSSLEPWSCSRSPKQMAWWHQHARELCGIMCAAWPGGWSR